MLARLRELIGYCAVWLLVEGGLFLSRLAYGAVWLVFGFAIPALLFFAVGLAPMRWLTWSPGFDGWLLLCLVADNGLMSGVMTTSWVYSEFTSGMQRGRALMLLIAVAFGLCGGSIMGAQWWQPKHFADLVWLVVGISALVGLIGARVLAYTRWRHHFVRRYDANAV